MWDKQRLAERTEGELNDSVLMCSRSGCWPVMTPGKYTGRSQHFASRWLGLQALSTDSTARVCTCVSENAVSKIGFSEVAGERPRQQGKNGCLSQGQQSSNKGAFVSLGSSCCHVLTTTRNTQHTFGNPSPIICITSSNKGMFWTI